MASTAVAEKLQIAMKHHQAGDVEQAAGLYQQVLEEEPSNADAWHLAGLVDFAVGNRESGEARIRRALGLNPQAVEFRSNLAAMLLRHQENESAEQLCREALKIDPQHVRALASLGTALRQQQRGEESLEVFRQAIDIERDATSLCNLATALVDEGRLDEAKGLLLEARDLDNNRPQIHMNLAVIYRDHGDTEEAARCLAVADLLQPASEDVYLARAGLLADAGQVADAIEQYQAAISLNPRSARAMSGLGTSLLQIGAWDEALESHRLAAVLEPNSARRASAWLYAATLNPRLTCEDVVRLHRDWGQQFEEQTPVEDLTPNLRTDRPLRIGYVSPDLRSHATMRFLYPLLQHHDRSAFQVVMYSQTSREDETTQAVRDLGDAWCCTKPLSDDQMVERIRHDQIDILIDVAGHTAENRLPVLARKPAPVQVSFLGYPNTTGLSRIDYFLTDAIREPDRPERFFTEQPVMLPNGACCFQALEAPDPAPSPHRTSGYVTLGSTHRPEKISTEALYVWARTLDALPDARLVIFRDTLKSESLRVRMAQRLQEVGADLARIDFGWDLPRPHLDVYSRFDILLDVFPWGSGTVAYDAMWMGVPIPTIAGDRGSCRATASLMHHCGFPELVAQSAEEYITIVKELADDSHRLVALRTGIRPAMTATVGNGQQFARDIESALRRFWKTYVDQQSASGSRAAMSDIAKSDSATPAGPWFSQRQVHRRGDTL